MEGIHPVTSAFFLPAAKDGTIEVGLIHPYSGSPEAEGRCRMHEMSIAQNVLEVVQQHASEQVKVIRLRIGALTNVIPDSLRFCFEAISEGTVAQGAALAIEEIPVCGYCKKCESRFPIENRTFLCPNCRNPGVDVTSGNELDVVELEM